jgi:phosphoribosylanthranilate isomerase
MRVKICGITNLTDAQMCAGEGANALGFIFHENSPRYIDPDAAAEIIRHLPPLVMTVGVFVNKPAELVNHTAKLCRLNAVQLHGEESPAYIRDIGYPVIKSFRIGPDFDFGRIDAYRENIILLDSFSKGAYGGTGKTFSWDSVPSDLREICIFAGGIGSGNIRRLMQNFRPAGIDLSSSLESIPGKKDPQKVKLFFGTIRNSALQEI